MNPARRLLLSGTVALGWPLALPACAAAPSSIGRDAVDGRAVAPDVGVPQRPLRAAEVGRGVFMFRGAAGEVDADNLGRVGNSGFIVGDQGVVVVDTGTSYRHGMALLAAIRRVTDRPIRIAIVTHTRQEFLFGAGAFQQQGIPVAMNRRAAGLMQARCERCLKTLRTVLGSDAMDGTAMWKPDRESDGGYRIDATGRPVEVIYHGHSSGPGDIAVLDRQSGVLFAGGLLDRLRVPDVQDADLPGWAAALKALRPLPLTVVVPGHGPPAPPFAVIDDVDNYLARLQRRLAELLQSGVALSDVPDAAALPEFADWDQYDTIHRRNASVLFVRLEREQMVRQTAPASSGG
jgi:glyoxylase-like metal-dependent hydrolase (beta-lactamase superfamily II)